ARDRRQGRALVPDARDAQAKADPIIVHPDVRRMLMEMKAFNESARALVLWGALQVDISRRAQTEEEREAASDLLGILTPVIKGYLTDQGFKAAVDAQQVYGGHGYIREWGMEQFVRDARIAQIYEGTNGIQALDLMWLKLAKASTAALAGGGDDSDFHQAKLITARFYAERILPQTGAERRKLEAGADSLMALPAEAF